MKIRVKKWLLPIINQAFFWFCSWNNHTPSTNIDPRLTVCQFHASLHSDDTCDISSPSRILSNLFWQHLPWEHIAKELGELNILDTGCGSGSYGALIDKYSNGQISHYVGLDVYRNESWVNNQLFGKATFHVFDGRSIAPHIPPETNFFMSQSAIEHFRNDHAYFQEIAKFIHQHPSRTFIQVHLFPSTACMKLYGRHGYRQYTPRTISKISRMFNDSQCILFGLGGPACNRIHEIYITQPLAMENIDYRKTKSDEYCREVLDAIQKDQDTQTTPTDPSFWALVICTNWKQPFAM